TVRDEALLDALSRRVRLFSIEQIARRWWAATREPVAAAGRRLRELERAGWITRLRVQARPVPVLLGPLVVWQPGRETPSFSKAARELRGRWTGPTRGVAATVLGPNGARHFGVSRGGRLKY